MFDFGDFGNSGFGVGVGCNFSEFGVAGNLVWLEWDFPYLGGFGGFDFISAL